MPDDHQEATGIAGLAAGDHLCCLYETEDEHRAVVAPFIRLGIERGERVFYIVDARNAQTIVAYLAQAGFDPKPAMDRGQFVISTREETYLRNGVFDPDAMLDLLRSESARAAADGYTALRVTGEMTWALRGDKGAERLMEYEAKLNRFFPGSNALAICQYDQRRFPAQVIQDVLRTHPFVVYRGQIYKNFYYIPVEDFLGPEKAEVEVEHWLHNLQREHDATATRMGLETEQRRILDALLESEERYRQLFENMQDGLAYCQMLVDDTGCPVDWIYLDVNRKFAELTGLKSVVDKRVTAVIPGIKESNPELFEIYGRVASTGRPERFETYLKYLDIWLQISVFSPARDRFVAIFENVTERKRAEEALRQSEANYRQLIESLNEGIWMIDEKAVTTFVNPRMVEMLGYTMEEMLGRHLFSFMDEQGVQIATRNLARGQQGIKELHEFEFLRKDGTRIYTSLASAPVTDLDGNYRGAVAGVLDITERKRVEEVLLASEERHRTVLRTAMDGFWLADMEGRLLEVNETYCRMSGYSELELQAMRIPDLEVAETADDTAAHIQKVVAQGEGRFKSRHHRKDGSVFNVEVSVQYRSNEGGRLVVFLRDVTEHKQAEEDLRFKNVILSTQQEASIDGILVVDENGRIISTNRRFVDMWDIPSGVMESRSDERALQSVMDKLADPEEFVRKVTQLYGARTETSLDEIALKDGHTFDRYSAPMFGPNDRYYGRVWYFRDITERKQVQDQIERLSRFPAENPSPVLRVSAQGVLEYANAASHALLPTTGAEVGGAVNAEWQAHIGEALAKNHPVDIEFQAGDRTFRATLSPVVDHDYVNLYVLDITERRRASNERERLIVELKDALAQVKTLNGIVPICAWCKKIRDDKGYWQQVEVYVRDHSEAQFSHGMCPECETRVGRELTGGGSAS